MSTALIPFFQRSVAEFAPTSLLNVGCVIRQEQITPDNSAYIQTTQELAKNGSKIILWTEGSGTITNNSELEYVISSIKNISRTYSAYVGVAYIFLGESKETSYNKLTVISSSGEIVMDYQKSHLVPFLETVRFSSGKAELPTYNSEEYGVIGGAICFDFNFPGFI
ncbi:26049_t:CDS:1, partial [Dentiscutata erythropus]